MTEEEKTDVMAMPPLPLKRLSQKMSTGTKKSK